jgi:ribonucleotide reductase beta subunit family protein with ferritin-like domain
MKKTKPVAEPVLQFEDITKYRDMVLTHYEKDEVIDIPTFRILLDKLIGAAQLHSLKPVNHADDNDWT